MPRLTENQRSEMILLYQQGDISAKQLGRKYGVCASAVSTLLKRRNIHVERRTNAARKYEIDEDYFSIINSEEKAYFLGLLYADGCNFIKNNTVVISLNDEDSHILEFFNKKVYLSDRPLYFKKAKRNTHSDSRILAICSKKICLDLEKLGCIPNKSLMLTFPTENQVPNNLINHFVRGYLDGDGCVHVPDNISKSVVSFTSSSIFCKQLNEFFNKELNLNFGIYIRNKSQINCSTININGFHQLNKLLNWIYKDANVYLYRKHAKYMKFQTHKLCQSTNS